jgi:hypothetical protein
MVDMRKKTYSSEWYRKKRDEMIGRFGGCCEVCGSFEHLEFAHKRGTGLNGIGRGSWQRINDVVKNPDAYRLLCKPCHRAFDLANSDASEQMLKYQEMHKIYGEGVTTQTGARG